MKRAGVGISIFLLIIFIACPDQNGANHQNNSITILYTNDEHGWLEGDGNYDGAAGMFGLWETREDYDGSDNYLILSGGDMWTGPAISTWYKGKSMIEVMNAMGYDAAAIGNHEFDFTVDTLMENLERLDFPLLAANIREKSSGKIPAFAKPYMVKDIDGINVGIIGLASQSTPISTFPAHVVDYEFTSYSEAVEIFADSARDKGADILIIIGHITSNEMQALSATASSEGILLIGGGHSHEKVLQESNGVLLIESGAYMQNYIRVDIKYDRENHTAEILSYKIEANQNSTPDQSILEIISKWKNRVQTTLSQVIGYCSETISKSSVEMANLVTDSWFYTFPDADVSVTNSGGIRQDIPAGDISLETIVGLLPFENSIVKLELSGNELKDCIRYYIIGGMTSVGGYYLSDGTPIYDDSVYCVLTTDYLYSVTNNNFSLYDPIPEETSVNYRQPLIDWLISINTSPADPLNNYLDYTPRKN